MTSKQQHQSITPPPPAPILPAAVEPLPAYPGMHSTALPVNVRRARRLHMETAALVTLDLVMVVLGFAAAWWVRYVLRLDFNREGFVFRSLDSWSDIGVIMVGWTMLLLWIKRSYSQPRHAPLWGQISTLASSAITGVGLTIISDFLIRRVAAQSRLTLLYAIVTMFAMLTLGRALLAAWRRWRWRNGYDLENVLVVGGTGLGREVMTTLHDSATTGYRLIGYVANPPDPSAPAPRFAGEPPVPQLGGLDDLPREVTDRAIDHVIVALPFWQHNQLPYVVSLCTQLGIDYQVVPDFYELSFDRVTIQEVRGTPLIGLRDNQIRGFNFLVKRVMDVALTLLAAPILIPLALIVALLVKLTSRGPVIYKQTRIGRHGHPFEFLKFRTMVINADELKAELAEQNEGSGPMFKMRHDPRVTPIGRYLRKLSLDELPQFWNVLRGDISLVGPRPSIPEEVAEYEVWQRRRLEVMPGITGLWQATGRSDTSFDHMVRLDIYYVEHWSLWLDLRIMLATIPSVLLGKGAY